MDKDLYPELLDYIFQYCGKYFWKDEIIANKHLLALAKSNKGVNTLMYKFVMKDVDIANHPKVAELVKDGFESFKHRVVTRIYNEHKAELDLNLCPKCGKVTRTPNAKQCRFCYYDWH
jgi:hypothetical protein